MGHIKRLFDILIERKSQIAIQDGIFCKRRQERDPFFWCVDNSLGENTTVCKQANFMDFNFHKHQNVVEIISSFVAHHTSPVEPSSQESNAGRRALGCGSWFGKLEWYRVTCRRTNKRSGLVLGWETISEAGTEPSRRMSIPLLWHAAFGESACSDPAPFSLRALNEVSSSTRKTTLWERNEFPEVTLSQVLIYDPS